MSADTSVPKQREAGLGEFESWLPDAVLRDASAGMAFLDTDLRFVWVNAALAEMYGRPVGDFAGQPVAEVWPAVDAARAEAALRQVLDAGPPGDGDVRARRGRPAARARRASGSSTGSACTAPTARCAAPASS